MGTPSLRKILGRLLDGFYPDCSGTKFRWRLDSVEERYVIRPTAGAAAKARRMLKREKVDFRIARTERLEEVLAWLMDREFRPDTWLDERVAFVYRTLAGAGLVETVEASDPVSGELAGAVLGVRLGRVFLADTMFQRVGGASKACLCELVIDLHARGFELIDVQNEHEDPSHPARRLGEERVAFLDYITVVRRSFAECAIGNLRAGG